MQFGQNPSTGSKDNAWKWSYEDGIHTKTNMSPSLRWGGLKKSVKCQGHNYILIFYFFDHKVYTNKISVGTARQWRIQRGFMGFALLPPPPPPPPPQFLNILWKWNNLVPVRPNYFIFIGYLGRMFKRTPQLNIYELPFQKSWIRPCKNNGQKFSHISP